ncbi:hypothetical protein AMJ52_02100 [candidate division TA06 bacterium DG_78]|uniref:Uncharacterized protein n=1 Tax=candidate division TA06 bacterium DG_78 TaxID=1703772 RepID=A0A0S7YH04_UNCT6|nr:MAG: hypothetical protein AMJ52_02100 [candidate division TA06 bacterium DG_78]
MAVGRFQVMATLQAARAYVLGLPITSAKSFGLQRAIFYAAAKRGFKGKGRVQPPKQFSMIEKKLSQKEIKKIQKSFTMTTIGDEAAYSVELDGKKLFVIGSEIKTDKDFERQVERRFGNTFKNVWKEAVALCKKYDKGVLLSQRYFYETIYKPQRDELAKKWTEASTT